MEMANDSLERRLAPRYNVSQHVRVTDINSTRVLGHIVNLSSTGFMLVSKSPVESRQRMYLLMELEAAAAGSRRVLLEAQCLWCGRSSFSEDFGAGFEIIRIEANEQRKLQQWISLSAGVGL